MHVCVFVPVLLVWFYFIFCMYFVVLLSLYPSRHLTSVGRQIDVRLRRHNDVGVRLILKVCLTSKTDVNLTC